MEEYSQGPVPRKDRSKVRIVRVAPRIATSEETAVTAESLPEETEESSIDDCPLCDPYVISQRLRALIKTTYELQAVGEELRGKIMALVAVLENRDFDEASLSAKAPQLIFGKRNRGMHARMGIIFESKRKKSRTEHLPFHHREMEIMNEIQTEALRALSIIAPEDDPLFELWLVENLGHAKVEDKNSIGEDALRLLGKRLSGKKAYRDELIQELETLRGEKIGKESFNSILARVRNRAKGDRFELKIGSESGKHGGRRFYYWININPGNVVDEELLEQKIWAARMSIPGISGDREANITAITDKPKNTRISKETMIRERGLTDLQEENPEIVGNKVHRSMSAAIARIETSPPGFIKQFTIRRLREGGGSKSKVEYVLMDRAESIKNWLEKMNTIPDSIKDRVLRKIFEYNLDTEFTSEQLVALLAEDGFETNTKRVNEVLREVSQRSKKTEYELAQRRDGRSTYHRIKI